MRFLIASTLAALACACAPTLDDAVEDAVGVAESESGLVKRRLTDRIVLQEAVVLDGRRLASGEFVLANSDTGDTGDTGGGDTGGGDTGGGETSGGGVNCDEESGYESTECSVGGQTCVCSGRVDCWQEGDTCVCALSVEDVDCSGGDTGDTGDTGIIQGAGF